MSDWITVVDDTTSNLSTLSYTLTEEGFRVSALRSGAELLDFLEKNTPDLILLDVHMPGMDGFETMNGIRQIESAKQIPVIFL
ncbi:MAG: response regulator, partial [Lachnospiraceae bacterium]|nr:response regulator [Lachnospiraceae bacterium]